MQLHVIEITKDKIVWMLDKRTGELFTIQIIIGG